MKSIFNISSLITLLIFLSTPLAHARSIACSHKELCQLIEIIAHENQLHDVQTENLVNVVGDPHEYDPSISELKKLINASFLVTGPDELNPWIKKILFQRSKTPHQKTISLLLSPSLLSLYPNATPEALSHFWLYPQIYCSLKSNLEQELKNGGYLLNKKSDCSPNKIEEELKNLLQQNHLPIILTHDALLPLLEKLSNGPSQKIMAIKGSGHHEETGPQSIKKMMNALNAPTVIWVIESGINIPPNILNKIRPQDKIIKLNTANTSGDRPFSTLYEFLEKLKSIEKSKGNF